MREILFRGKRLDNGEWIQGDLVQFPAHGVVRIIKQEQPYEDAEVDLDTVGQYTGLTDKNGRKIFEGDIVEYPIEQGKYSEQDIHEVVFETRQGAAYFGIKMSDIETWDFCLSVPAKLMRVIGNIHDNPELLEVTK